MTSHAPPGYVCPICLGVEGVENENTLLRKDDLVYRDDQVTAFINSFWVGQNEGHVIVVPNQHFETLYDLPTDLAAHIFQVVQRLANTMKMAYDCDGITLRQNNEPAGDQHAFHFHLHIFPRYQGDNFNQRATEPKKVADPELRALYAQKLRSF